MKPMNDDAPDGRGVGRSRAAGTVVPIAVLVAFAAVIAWSVWPLLRPARSVTVVQAVMERGETVAADTSPGEPRRDAVTVQAPGWLEAEPFMVACTALADGVVEQILVLEGEYVEKNAEVARLVAEDSEIRLRRAEAGLGAARAELARAEAELVAAERSWAEPVELDRALAATRAGLAESEGELSQLPSLIESARATLTRLEEETRRVQDSTARGAASDFELIAATQRAAAQRAEVAGLEAREPILVARVDRLRAEARAAERDLELRIEDRRRLDSARASAEAARAGVASAEAERDAAALELERMVIRAPISGYVQRRLKGPGDKVIRMMDDPHSSHIVHLYDPERLQVRVDVPLADASHVAAGQACEVVVEVLPDRVFRGEVLRSTHEADLQKNTLQVKVKVFDPDPILRPEMLTRVKFLPAGGGGSASAAAPEGTGHVLLPVSLIGEGGETGKVWLVTQRKNGRGVLVSRPVRVITRDGDWMTVEGNLRPGDLVVVGLEKPREGELVVVGGDAGIGDEGEPS